MSSLVKEGRPMPTKLSEWLRVAVEDNKRIPAECSTPTVKRFIPDMSTYAKGPKNGKCMACFAGMAMFGTGVWAPGIDPSDLDHIPEASALNSLRAGDVRGAFVEFMGCHDLTFSPRVEKCAERVHAEAREAYGEVESESGGLYEPDMDELVGGPTADCRASDEAYLELADALAEMGL